MSVSDGQDGNAAVFNAAFMSRLIDSSTVGKVDLSNADSASGTAITNMQRELNSLAYWVGKAVNVAKDADPSWANDYVGAANDTVYERIEALVATYDGATGHTHDGTNGEGALISASDLADINQYFAEFQAGEVDTASGTSYVVTTEFGAKTAGGGAAAEGVITDAPNNRVELRDKSTGDNLEDTAGQKVYGRLTEAAGVWTLSFYTNEAGTETAHNLSSNDLTVYFREVFDQSNRPTIPADIGAMGSLDLTADIVDASATERGVVTTGTQSMAGAKTFTGDLTAGADLIITDNIEHSIETGITAFAGGGITDAYEMTKDINFVSTVVSNSDSVQLPSAVAGMQITVANTGASTLRIFPQETEEIEALGTNIGLDLGKDNQNVFQADATGHWERIAAATSGGGGFDTDVDDNAWGPDSLPGTLSAATNNTAVGFQAGSSVTGGDHNVFFGQNAGDSVTSGGRNVIIGRESDIGADDDQCVIIGYTADANGDNGTGVGYNAQVTGNGTAVGHFSVAVAEGVALGEDAKGNSANSVAVGNSSRTAVDTVAVGTNSEANTAEAVTVGSSATTAVASSGAISIGYSASTDGNDTVAVGRNALADAADAIAIGSGADAGGGEAVAIGKSADASGTQTIAIGGSAASVATGGIAIGQGADVNLNHFDSIALGQGAQTDDEKQFVIGSASADFKEMIIGKGPFESSAGAITNIRATDALGTDIAARDLSISGGRGTGTGDGGELKLNYAPAGTTGSSKNALVTAATVKTTGAVNHEGLSSDPTGAAGDLIYNSTANAFKFHNGSSWAELAAAGALTVQTETDNYTVLTGDDIVIMNAATAKTFTLYAASGNAGKILYVKNINTGTLTVDANASETIDGELTLLLPSQNDWCVLVCDGTNWQIISEGINTSFYVTLGTNQSITDAAFNTIELDTVQHDTHSAFDTSTNYRYDIPRKGKWVFTAGIELSSFNSDETCRGRIINQNGGTVNYGVGQHSEPSSDRYVNISTCAVDFTTSDYMLIQMDSVADTSYTVDSGTSTFLSGYRIGN